jgi:hypothetical protein
MGADVLAINRQQPSEMQGRWQQETWVGYLADHNTNNNTPRPVIQTGESLHQRMLQVMEMWKRAGC